MAAVFDLDVFLIGPDEIILLDLDKHATLDTLTLISISMRHHDVQRRQSKSYH